MNDVHGLASEVTYANGAPKQRNDTSRAFQDPQKHGKIMTLNPKPQSLDPKP